MPFKDPERQREYDRLYAQKWNRLHPERVQATRLAFYERHRERLRARRRELYRKNKVHEAKKHRSQTLRRLYGLTEEQYAALGSACAICGATEDSRTKAQTNRKFRLAVDHCHDTKRIRGVLCGNCNCGIGYFKHDVALMMKAIAYLQKGE